MRQKTFAECGFEQYRKPTRRELFLAEMDEITLPVEETAREARMRRLANKHGLRLHKSRRDIDKGLYSLIDAYRNFVVFSYNSNLGCCEATLDEVEEYLKEGE